MLEYFTIVFSLNSLLVITLGTVAGVAIGGMPGLTATMAVGLLVPFTYTMDPTAGLMLLGGIYCGAMYGGSIPAILLNTPGTPAAVATAIEGYPMSCQDALRLPSRFPLRRRLSVASFRSSSC